MSTHHELRKQITDALIEAAGGFEDTATGRMIVANVDDLGLAVSLVVHGLEVRMQEAKDEAAIAEFTRELETWNGS